MKILFISNFYPPARPGGYTQWCQEIAERLAHRGHEIRVLTSRHQREECEPEPDVLRELHLAGDLSHYKPGKFFTSRRKHETQNHRTISTVISKYKPELAFIWGMWAMSHRVPMSVDALLPGRSVYYLSDYWPMNPDFHSLYWSTPARRRWMRYPKAMINWAALRSMESGGRKQLEFRHAICVSQAVKEILISNGLPLQNAVVVHGGTDLERFGHIRRNGNKSGTLRLLYAGQLVWHKGVHTAIRAMAHLINDFGMRNIDLRLIGSGPIEYESYLSSMVDDLGIGQYVNFDGQVNKNEMPEWFSKSDVLVFPSVYEEPLARVTQEAMASGMIVVGTTTGGSSEILSDGHNALTFPAEDSLTLAKQVERLARDPLLRRKLSDGAKETVATRFTLDRMVGEIENYLQTVISA